MSCVPRSGAGFFLHPGAKHQLLNSSYALALNWKPLLIPQAVASVPWLT